MSKDSDRATDTLAVLFSSRVRLKVLQRLVSAPGARYHARELAKVADEHFNAVWQELKHLEALGVLRSQKVGNQVQYEADPDLPILAELRLLLGKTEDRTAAPAPPSQPITTAQRPAAAAPVVPDLVMGETD